MSSQAVRRETLWVVVCAAPPAADLPELLGLAAAVGWRLQVLATPDALAFLDAPAVERASGQPVRSTWRSPELPGLPDLDPGRDLVLAAPATFTTINKLCAGIADNPAVGLVCEALGAGVPVVVAPNVKQALASHPQFANSLAVLARWGVVVVPQLPNPRGRRIPPWPEVLAAVEDTHRRRGQS